MMQWGEVEPKRSRRSSVEPRSGPQKSMSDVKSFADIARRKFRRNSTHDQTGEGKVCMYVRMYACMYVCM